MRISTMNTKTDKGMSTLTERMTGTGTSLALTGGFGGGM
jgi:hypothetical protein